MSGLMPVEQAQRLVVEEATRLRDIFSSDGLTNDSERIGLIPEALGRVVAEEVRLDWHLPTTRVSIKDGFAIRSEDCRNAGLSAAGKALEKDAREAFNAAGVSKPFLFRLVGDCVAGGMPVEHESSDEQDEEAKLPPAWYVTTGSPLPPSFDVVVQVENSLQLRSGRVTLLYNEDGVDFPAGQDVRQPGSDMEAGTLIAKPGETVDATTIGLLAMAGRSSILCARRPKVGIASSGDELVSCQNQQESSTKESFSKVRQGQLIFDANRPMLLAMLCNSVNGGCIGVDLGILEDQNAIASGAGDQDGDEWLNKVLASDLDVLITSGGVSMGRRDFIRGSLERRGKILVERLFMKPGKPMMVTTVPRGKSGQRPLLIFSLPGNPVSSAVTFSLLVAPALKVLAGWKRPLPAVIACKLAHDIRLDPVRPEYHRARLSYQPGNSIGERGEYVAMLPLATSTGPQRSSTLNSMSAADVLLELPNSKELGSAFIQRGTIVRAIMIGDVRQQSHLTEASNHQYIASSIWSNGDDKGLGMASPKQIKAKVRILCLDKRAGQRAEAEKYESIVQRALASIDGVQVSPEIYHAKSSDAIPILGTICSALASEADGMAQVIAVDNYYAHGDAGFDGGGLENAIAQPNSPFRRIVGLEEVSRSVAVPLAEDLVAASHGAGCFLLALDLGPLKRSMDDSVCFTNAKKKLSAILTIMSATA